MPSLILLIMEDPQCCEALRQASSRLDVTLLPIASVVEAVERIKQGELSDAAGMIIDYSAATSHMGGGDTTTINRSPLKLLKDMESNPAGRRFVLGVATLAPFCDQMKALGCDRTCAPAEIEQMLYTHLPQARRSA